MKDRGGGGGVVVVVVVVVRDGRAWWMVFGRGFSVGPLLWCGLIVDY